MSKNQEEALGRFTAIVGEINETLEQIQDAADSHFDTEPENVTWAHVGDVTRTLNDLKHVLAVIRGENT